MLNLVIRLTLAVFMIMPMDARSEDEITIVTWNIRNISIIVVLTQSWE